MKKNGYLYLLVTFILWGSLYVVSKAVLDRLPVFTVSFLRFAIGGTSLFLLIRRRTLPRIEKRDYIYVALIGVVGYFIALGAQIMGTQLAGASVASLVNSLNPVAILIAAALILGEKLTWRKVAGVLVALVGVYFIIGGGRGGALWGIVCSLFSVLLWSVVSVFIRKVTQKYDPLQITTYGLLIAAACNLPVAAVETAAAGGIAFDLGTVGALLYMGIACTGLGHLLWNKSLSVLPAGTCSLFYPIQPVTSVLLGALFLGETISIKTVIGGLLIALGIIICLLRISGRQERLVTLRER